MNPDVCMAALRERSRTRSESRHCSVSPFFQIPIALVDPRPNSSVAFFQLLAVTLASGILGLDILERRSCARLHAPGRAPGLCAQQVGVRRGDRSGAVRRAAFSPSF